MELGSYRDSRNQEVEKNLRVYDYNYSHIPHPPTLAITPHRYIDQLVMWMDHESKKQQLD